MCPSSWEVRFSLVLIFFMFSSGAATSEKIESICGNGMVETGEECDCGTGFNCAEKESCCDNETCNYRGTDYSCRAVSTLHDAGCDIPEYCTGSSSACPPDSFMRDASECGKDGVMSHCYSGKCRTRKSQCQHYWGEESRDAATYCYEQQNTIGNKYGNCGVDKDGAYKECSAGDEYCGKLFCENDSERTLALPASYYSVYTITYIGDDEEALVQCISVNISLDDSNEDPGLVYDGTICGNNSICVENRCVNLSLMGPGTCPEVGGRECAGNGLCDNDLKCQCKHSNYSDPDLCFGPLTSFADRLKIIPICSVLFVAYFLIAIFS